MASVNYVARYNAVIDRYNALIESLRAVHRMLRRGRVSRGIQMLEEKLDGVLSDATESDEPAEQPAEALSASSWALQWYEQLPDGRCRRAVQVVRNLRVETGADETDALLDAFAYAQQHFPEEIVLWTLAGGVVPDAWGNASVQAGVRSSLLALRSLRQTPANVPANVPGVMLFSGVGHQLN